MSRKGRLDLNSEGIKAYLRSESVTKLVDSKGKALQRMAAEEAGEGAEFDVRTFAGKDRARSHVGTANYKAKRAEAKKRTLTRSAYRMGGR